MQNLGLQINPSLGEQYYQTTGSVSRRLLNSRVQLPKSSEAWHEGRAPLWGPLAVPVSYRSEFPALLLLSFPHSSAKKAHRSTKVKSGIQLWPCLSWCAGGHAAFHLRLASECTAQAIVSVSGSNLKLKIHLQSYGILCNTWHSGLLSMFIRRWGDHNGF